MKRRIMQRIENQRWVYYVQKRRFFFFWKDAEGPFAHRHTAMERVMDMRARDDYGGHMPWEAGRLIHRKDTT